MKQVQNKQRKEPQTIHQRRQKHAENTTKLCQMKMQKLCPVKGKYNFTYEEQNFQYL